MYSFHSERLQTTMARHVQRAAQGRVIFQVLAAATAIWWLLYWIIRSSNSGRTWVATIDDNVKSKFLGTSGSVFMLQILPIVVISIVGFVALELRRRIKPLLKVRSADKKPRINIWTMPMIVRSPFGMLTLGDIILIVVILSLTLGYFLVRTIIWCHEIDGDQMQSGHHHHGTPQPRWIQKVFAVGLMLGVVTLIPMALLWIPVSRGSPILNVIGVPFERAVKYHIWLGSLTIWLAIFHGIVLAWYYIQIHQANKEGLFSWDTKGIAIVPGDIAFVAGVVMLVTALERVRRKSFDLFFTVHHLYLAFLLFFAFHCAWCIDYIIVPVLLFFLDRFMRLVQSRKSVDVLSAKILGSGAIELTAAKPSGSTYHALSFLYVLLPSVSRLMWHPFSVASSPLDESNQITIYIKPLGEFTEKLHDILLSSKQSKQLGREVFKCPFSFKVGLEGPYGSESMFYLRYKSLVMVAGGIGVTPFLAIIKDILHRHRLQQEGLPSSILLILCVKTFSELQILDTLAPNAILPGYDEHLKITVNAYVTQESDAQKERNTYNITSLPSGKVNLTPAKELSIIDHGPIRDRVDDVILYSSAPKGAVQEMSTIGSAGNSKWVAATFISTLVGYFVIFGSFSLKVPNTENSGPVRVMFYMVSILLAVVVFGGGVMLVWALHDRGARKSETKVDSQLSDSIVESPTDKLEKDIESNGAAAGADESFWQGNVTFGRRPNWKEMFSSLATKHAGQDVGVMVSGATQMQQDVASYCKLHSLPRASTVVFHYHSVSFDL